MKLPQNKPLVVWLRWNENSRLKVGRLAFKSKVFFEFDEEFLKNPLPISPFQLITRPGVLSGFQPFLEGLPGVFADSLPDGYGRLLVDRIARSKGGALTALDRLAIVGEAGTGALVYEPDNSFKNPRGPLNIDDIAAEAMAALDGESEEVIKKIIHLQGGTGGVRPKVLIAYSEENNRMVTTSDAKPGYDHYLLKFAAKQDPVDIGAIEYAYWMMAKIAGLRVPGAKLFSAKKGPGYFASERFDITDGDRAHVHTAAGLLGIDFRTPSLDYENLLTLCMKLTQDMGEVLALYRVAVFNVIAHNRDDHSKQFSFLMSRSGEWKAAPAYDLTFAEGPQGEHFMSVAGEGRQPKPEHLLKLASTAGIRPAEANAVIEEVTTAVCSWKKHAFEAGVSKGMTNSIAKALAVFSSRN